MWTISSFKLILLQHHHIHLDILTLSSTSLVLHTLQQLCTHTQASRSIFCDQQSCLSYLSAQPLRNNLNSCRRRMNYRINRWHLLHHVLPLEELATSGLKHKIDYTQSRTQPRSKTKTWDTYRKVGALIEHAVKVLLCGCSVPICEDIAIRAIHPPCVCDSQCSVVWALRHGCCLRGDRGRVRET
jgi:hypothetical protein